MGHGKPKIQGETQNVMGTTRGDGVRVKRSYQQQYRYLARFLLFALVLCLASPVSAEQRIGKYRFPRNLGRIRQFLLSPQNTNRGWVVTNDGVSFSRNVGKGVSATWVTVFNRRTFQRLTGVRARRSLKFAKIFASAKTRGKIFLLANNRQDSSSHFFYSKNYGKNWRYLGMRDSEGKVVRPGDEPAEKPSPSSVAKGATGGDEEEGAIDLGSLSASSEVDLSAETGSSQASAHAHGSGAQPIFKAYFDLIYHIRPGISPGTFDNYHSLLLMDIIPKPGILFSFEVNPSPRYFQLDLELSEMFTLILGKYQIPFDDMTPHNRFGGYLNNSQTAQPNAPAFLPDIWADLGVGLKVNLVQSSALEAAAWIYLANGFNGGGQDPKNQVSSYPNFGSLGAEDNNSDKAFGGRVKATFFNTVSFGVSLYNSRYTPDTVESKRITMIGLDGGIRLKTRTSVKIGYAYTTVELLDNPDGDASFERGGLYGLVRQRVGPNFYVDFEGGILQTDSRVTDAGDQMNIGFRVGYDAQIFDLSINYRYDLESNAAKLNRNYTAARFVVKM